MAIKDELWYIRFGELGTLDNAELLAYNAILQMTGVMLSDNRESLDRDLTVTYEIIRDRGLVPKYRGTI